MIQTTFRELRENDASPARYKYLAKKLGGITKYGKDTPITLLQILDYNGFDDTMWALSHCTINKSDEKLLHLLACDFAEHVLPIFEKNTQTIKDHDKQSSQKENASMVRLIQKV